jgi:hypothetical protein
LSTTISRDGSGQFVLHTDMHGLGGDKIPYDIRGFFISYKSSEAFNENYDVPSKKKKGDFPVIRRPNFLH